MTEIKRENYNSDSEYYEDKYEEFFQFIAHFAYEPEFTPGIKDIDIIKKYVESWPTKNTLIHQAISEGKEILSLDPFPWKWVSSVANGIGISQKGDETKYTREELAKRWVKWMVQALEEEAKKQGKI